MLTDAEYGYCIRHRAALRQEIDSAAAEEDQHDGLKQAAKARGDRAKLEMVLFTNRLKPDLDEYEAAHPPPEGE